MPVPAVPGTAFVVIEADIVAVVRGMPESAQAEIIRSLSDIRGDAVEPGSPDVSQEQFISALSHFLTDPKLQAAFYAQLPRVQIGILKAHVDFLRDNLDKNETFIQNWIDEDDGNFRKQRCLIFGLEYVDPVREGQVASKKFDILAEQDLEHHVIFELKSPQDDIFKVTERDMTTGGFSTEYQLSPQLSRAIPEVLGYRKMYEHAQSEELQKLGIRARKPVSKCVIVLGTRKDDQVWRENFDRVCGSLSGIELLTYNHLIDRLENTIRNLEEHASTL
jgi:antiviral defense system Shedu protein SduA